MRVEMVVALIGDVASVAVAYIAATNAGATAGATAGNETAANLIPMGAVIFYNGTSCLSTWKARADAEGRYLVGLSSKFQGSLNQAVGSPLANLENGAVGAHTHKDNTYSVGGVSDGNDVSIAWGGKWAADTKSLTVTGAGPENVSGETNTVAGTNAPYLQLLACEKT